MDDQDSITVAVTIDPGLVPSDTVEIWDWIYDHVDQEWDSTVITYHVKPPEPAWEKEVWINGLMYGPGDSPFTVVPSDTVTIVDRVWITAVNNVILTLVEEWTDSLALVDWEYTAGSVVTGTNALTWDGVDELPNTWHILTKTFHVEEGDWDVDLLTETLEVELADPQPEQVALEFQRGCIEVSGADFTFVPTDPLVGQTVTFTGTVSAGTPSITYTWDLGDGSTAQVGNPITHNFPITATAQTYTVTLTAANACPSQQVVEKPITVWPRYIYLPVIMRGHSP